MHLFLSQNPAGPCKASLVKTAYSLILLRHGSLHSAVHDDRPAVYHHSGLSAYAFPLWKQDCRWIVHDCLDKMKILMIFLKMRNNC